MALDKLHLVCFIFIGGELPLFPPPMGAYVYEAAQ